jgi:predicted ester cyclase
MSIKENKGLIRRMFDLYNRRELDAYYDLIAPDAVLHASTGDISMAQSKPIDAMFLASFPDFTSTIGIIVAEGDYVAFQVTWRGTHKTEFMGFAPTGNKVEMTNTDIFRIANGKMVEGWATMDISHLMQQLGAISKK